MTSREPLICKLQPGDPYCSPEAEKEMARTVKRMAYHAGTINMMGAVKEKE